MKIERLMEIVKQAIAKNMNHVKTTGPGNKTTTRTKLKGTVAKGPRKDFYRTNSRRKFGGGIPGAELPPSRGNR